MADPFLKRESDRYHWFMRGVVLICVLTAMAFCLAVAISETRGTETARPGVLMLGGVATVCETIRDSTCGHHFTNCEDGSEYKCVTNIRILKTPAGATMYLPLWQRSE